MLVAYVVFGFVIGLFLFLAATTDDPIQTFMKAVMGVWTLWSAALLVGIVARYMQESGTAMRLF